jgi:hypothetical protein
MTLQLCDYFSLSIPGNEGTVSKLTSCASQTSGRVGNAIRTMKRTLADWDYDY